MSIKDRKYSILLLNMGGPKNEAGVQDFLYRLFSDKDIIKLPLFQSFLAWWISIIRAPKVVSHYKKIGGGSPILDWTIKQAQDLQKKLLKSINCRVHIGMRYTKPFIDEAVQKVKQNDEDFCLVCLPLYPHFSKTTTQSSYNELDRVLKRVNFHPRQIRIQHWFNFPIYIEVLNLLIKKKLKSFEEKIRDKVHLLFSAHSLPMKEIEQGDPYEGQIHETMRRVLEKFNGSNPSHLCYQSKVGPIEWLGPSTDASIQKIAQKKDQDILVIPMSFVSDHYEVNYEIDIQYRELAKDLGIRTFKRMESLNNHPLFIQALSEIVLKYIGES